METMVYADARSKIHDGDLISVFKAHSLFGKLTQFFTGEYTHVGIAIWLDGGLWLTEINGGRNHAIPLSQLKKCGFDVSSPPPGCNPFNIRHVALASLRESEEYGFINAAVTGFIEFFKIPITINWRKGRHCAGYCIRIYDRAGWSLLGGTHSYLMSPTALTARLTTRFRVVG